MRAGWIANAVGLPQAAADLLFPPRCAFCDGDWPLSPDGASLCAECREQLVPWLENACPRCGSQLTVPELDGGRTPLCGCKLPHLDGVISLGLYRDALREAVLRMKHRTGDCLSAAIGRLYAQVRGEALARFQADVIAPVPMYWRRRLVRGTNSPEIVARILAARLGAPLAARAVVRCRNTLPQSDLSPEERWKNVRGAFRLRAGYDLRGARILLVDDILTTGATAGEIARVLRLAGARAVAAAAVARADGAGRSP